MSWQSEHYSYACDTQRTALYRDAIAKVISPQDHVLDLGCGVGILGALCLEAGATRVTGIDETAACDAASDVYRRALPSAKITTVRKSSFEVALQDRADLIICDHVGYFGLDYGILGLLQDARARFLAPGGKIVPSGLTLHMAPVGSDACKELAFGWSAPDIPEPLHPLRNEAVNAKYAITLRPAEILATPVELGQIDFMTEASSYFSYRATTTVTRAGEMHGLAGWFDCTLCAGVTMTNNPLAPQQIDRNQALFPIEKPLAVTPGDTISFSMAMRPDDGSFAWTVHHEPSGTRFRQATLHSTTIGKDDLRMADQSRVPELSEQAKAGQIVMSYCDGRRSVAEIRAAVLKDHPDLMPSKQATEEFITDWLASWTR